jgi:hypothetical protein
MVSQNWSSSRGHLFCPRYSLSIFSGCLTLISSAENRVLVGRLIVHVEDYVSLSYVCSSVLLYAGLAHWNVHVDCILL